MRRAVLAGAAGVAALTVVTLAFVVADDDPPSADTAALAEQAAEPTQEAEAVETSFLLVGDAGEGGDREAATSAAAKALAEDRDVFVSTGDNVASRLATEALRRNYGERWGWARDAGLEVVAALGDNDAARADLVRELTGAPAGWFSHRSGSVEWFVLDTNHPRSDAQRAWLERALPASTAPWRVMVLHEPPFACSQSQGRRAVRDQWVPLFEEHGVDLVLTGHHHSYQRFEPLNGVTYVIASGSGARAHAVDETSCPTATALVASDDEHLKLYRGLVTDRALELDVVDVESGEILDQLRLRR